MQIQNNSKPSKGYDNVDKVLWGNTGRFNMSSVLVGNDVESGPGKKAWFDPKSVKNITGPTILSYKEDHEGLNIHADSN